MGIRQGHALNSAEKFTSNNLETHSGVIFQIIWRLLFHAIWHMMPKTKGVDWRDRPGSFLALAVGRALVGLVG
jgi:hypothetical protein